MKAVALTCLLFLSFSVSSQSYTGDEKDIGMILSNIKDFSNSVMNSDYQAIGKAYTEDAKIFPNNRDIIAGQDAIIKYWTLPEGLKTKYHKITPEEIKIIGNEAYDYGYYEGTTLRADGTESNWKGKYVIVWKKLNDEWKIYLDIWNSIKN
ncbi:nuclear transport factor 2 family protein [Psychroserpens sp.]|uniref:YybH family protein n=1 Tax=Psychroserpens sp. TaxID=2020870 RepID=UPI001B0C60E7|nr:nuclear transport factor 2 family protein [Psychroserpens sp.]MBO6606110.1 nuclear transport factor 2 family protein [Psychroserpens sp.]MBO6630618.1 nuclear transport factor 2 family protein [Psychroserpens sp.]MBO6652519.1 nuclear transport factor 2 family protein [Psychroserpens sp.]MBO6681709.1 nuclear transport factor 2 family protein [Psychroserpens sp.]MBO6749484.1 nuclear transport factor 2 family protein [Psychroserpens sp.]